MEGKKSRIMIVEDDILICEDLKRVLSIHNYQTSAIFHTGEDAIEQVVKINPDLIIMDIVLSGHLNGIDTAKKIHKKMDCPIIFLTAYSDAITKKRVASVKYSAYILKPFRDTELITAIDKTLS